MAEAMMKTPKSERCDGDSLDSLSESDRGQINELFERLDGLVEQTDLIILGEYIIIRETLRKMESVAEGEDAQKAYVEALQGIVKVRVELMFR